MNKRYYFLFLASILFVYSVQSMACDPVTGLSTSAITPSSATLHWNPVVCDSFLVRYWINGTQDFQYQIVNPGTSVSVTLVSLYPNTKYNWLIHTYCNGGQTGPYQTSPSSFTTTNGYVPCLVPNGLFARDITATTANVAWNHLIDADSFLVRYHIAGTSDFSWKYVPGMYHSVTLTNLPSSSIFEWNVRAVCDGSIIPTNHTDTFVTNCDTLPVPDHIVICIMENKGFPQIIDSFAIAPYINALANDSMSALFTQSYAIEYPSQPNYLDLFSGSNQGMTTNAKPPVHFTTPNLARELLDAGKTFVTYSQSLPYTGSDTIQFGDYWRKHNPVANWMGTGLNQVPDTCNQPFTNFPTDFNLLPTVSYVVPDQANDMHNGTITQGDTWMANNLDAYVQWAKANNSLFILTFDEDNHAYGNHIITLFTGPMVRGGYYPKYMNHFSLLRTLEDMYSLGHAGRSHEVESVRECWRRSLASVGETETSEPEWTVFSNAELGELQVDLTLLTPSKVAFEVFTTDGRLVKRVPVAKKNAGTNRTQIRLQNPTLTGLLLVRLFVDDRFYSKKTVLVHY